ncbi:MAG: hypothetical protein EP330_10395 [Deltaproteobacteria bacterium]|nr:MAG: hypothetical protein EP330_10395 [Deltaproteobacteria bacterium]
MRLVLLASLLVACGKGGPEGVRDVATNGTTVAVVDSEGFVWAWGLVSGMVGGQAVVDSPTPVKLDGFRDGEQLCLGNDFGLLRAYDGSMVVWDLLEPGEPYLVQSLVNTRGVACGGFGLYAIDELGVPWVLSAAGTSNAVDARITVEGFPPLVEGDCGDTSCAFVDENGALWTYGDNDRGQLGSGTTTDLSDPVLTPLTSGVEAVSVGGGHVLALANDELWGWGANDMGQLGLSDLDDRPSPERITSLAGVTHIGAGRAHSLARFSDRTVAAMGANNRGQLGDGTLGDAAVLYPQLVIGLTDATSVWAEGDLGLATSSFDGFVAWGDNAHGQLGTSSYTESGVVHVIGPVP